MPDRSLCSLMDANNTEDSEKNPRKTQHLGEQSEAEPMPLREPNPGTTQLTSAWKIRFRIDEQVQRLDIDHDIVVGRAIDEEEDITLDLTTFGAYHFGVSRRHAIISLHEGHLYIEDLGSMNGTRINGFQLTPKQKYRLRDGDEVEFARLRTIIRFEPAGS